MASLYKTALAVCLLGHYGLQTEAAATITYKFTPVDVDDAGYLAANLVRNGKLPVHISTVEKAESIVTALTNKVKSRTATKNESDVSDGACDELVKQDEVKDIFHYTFDYEEGLDYSKLLQKALDAGLEVFKETQNQNKWETIWQDGDGANLAYLLGANSTTIGCVIGQCTTKTNQAPSRETPDGSTTGKAVLFCELKPAADKGKAPFDDEYFNGLIARTAKLADMTEEDLKAPSNDGTAAAAAPTILAAGFVAVLSALSV
ncbi:SAG family member [Eimeria brunetti]|uniref:SAG family member n=1 Tax=Eimeria brunetti TaxID=51314 RepID=U6LD01_9EIME|nr:SAG family member [Eimeria brunetti]